MPSVLEIQVEEMSKLLLDKANKIAETEAGCWQIDSLLVIEADMVLAKLTEFFADIYKEKLRENNPALCGKFYYALFAYAQELSLHDADNEELMCRAIKFLHRASVFIEAEPLVTQITHHLMSIHLSCSPCIKLFVQGRLVKMGEFIEQAFEKIKQFNEEKQSRQERIDVSNLLILTARQIAGSPLVRFNEKQFQKLFYRLLVAAIDVMQAPVTKSETIAVESKRSSSDTAVEQWIVKADDGQRLAQASWFFKKILKEWPGVTATCAENTRRCQL